MSFASPHAVRGTTAIVKLAAGAQRAARAASAGCVVVSGAVKAFFVRAYVVRAVVGVGTPQQAGGERAGGARDATSVQRHYMALAAVLSSCHRSVAV